MDECKLGTIIKDCPGFRIITLGLHLQNVTLPGAAISRRVLLLDYADLIRTPRMYPMFAFHLIA